MRNIYKARPLRPGIKHVLISLAIGMFIAVLMIMPVIFPVPLFSSLYHWLEDHDLRPLWTGLEVIIIWGSLRFYHGSGRNNE